MNTHNQRFTTRASIAAVRGAMLVMALLPDARAAESATPNPAVAELTQQSSSVELGVGYVSNDSFKFGEYNGLQGKGGYAIGNIDLRGGGSYDSNDATRWRIRGNDLGLDTREFSAEYSAQGSFRLNLGYDELRRNRSDSYQTPYLGAGSNSLTLPSNWVVPVVPRISATTANARGLSPDVAQSPALVAGVPTALTAGQLATSNALIGANIPAFHNVDLDTKRKRTELGLNFLLDRQWTFKTGFRHEDKQGLKPMSTVTRQTGSDIATVIPDLIDQSTDQWDVGLNFTGEKGFLSVGYYGSVFQNNVVGMSWQNWAKLTPPNFNTISSAPGNQFHQLNLTGGYDYSPTTRLAIDAALGRSTQNESFLSDATAPVVPVSSANALVVSKTLNLKLTSRPNAALQLSAGYKLDDRDNRTPVNTYQFSDANQTVAPLNTFNGAVVAQNANANQPYSKRMHKIELGADYRLATGQFIKVGDEYQTTERWCAGSWIDCADATTTKENTLRLEYRNSVIDNLSGRVSLEHGRRSVDNYNENAFLSLVPHANVSPTGAPGGATAYATMVANGLNGWGPNSGFNPVAPAGSALAFFFPGNNALSNALYANENRISELPGMRRYNMADRSRDKLRTALNWQANEQWDVQGGINFQTDDYTHSVYGLKQSRGWSLNLDASYQASDSLNINAFYTLEDQHAKSAGNTYTANSNGASVNGFTAVSGGCFADIATRNLNNKIDPCNNWSADLHDRIDTLGIAFRHNSLIGGKLQLIGDLSLTLARSDSAFSGGNYVNNPLAVAGAPAGTIAAYYVAATLLPTATTKSINLHLATDYALDKQRSVRVGYFYSHLHSVDWAYDGMQYGGLAPVLPSHEQSPNYSVHAIGITYLFRFH
jgi:MtrB/PioB family decaheme-associated outer membrane protein